MEQRMTVLVIGATGSIGRLAVDEALRRGHAVRALVRDPGRASRLARGAQVIIGDVTRPNTLAGALEGVDAVVFTTWTQYGRSILATPARFENEARLRMTQGIEGKVVVITGASSGLGEATARRLAREGAKLMLGARRIERLQALADELALGKNAAVQTDVTQCDQVRRLVDDAVQAHGRIDVILNNAGLMPHSPL